MSRDQCDWFLHCRNHFHKWLTDNDITELFIGGVSTVAIQSTARQAHDLGYFVTVLEDLCRPTPELHQQSIQALMAW
ncbi:isochorismatase family protein [Providencia rettgeri]|uniref:Isochorismatase family protein n=1 Tax=Providencia rettgeri TaxID=587 RepID=A0A939NER6_PRORE|nr:isochorismatase family protein [Providencia rettgeri]